MANELIKDFQIVELVNYADHNGVAIDGSTYLLGDAVNMQDYNHATIIITCGEMTGTPAAQLKQSTSAGLGSEKALAFDKMYANVAYGTQNAYTETAVTSDTFELPGTDYNTYVIEVEANTLDRANNFDWLRLDVASDGNSNTFGAICILSKPNYRAAVMPSAIV